MILAWGLNSFDRDILLFLNQFAGRFPVFDALVTMLATRNLLKGAVITVLFVWIWFRTSGDKTRDHELVIWSFFISMTSIFVARALAFSLPFRERPLRVPELQFHVPYAADRLALIGWSAFPSDHAAIFFAASTALLFISRQLGILSLLYTFFAICIPRVYLGVHYPTDIIAGALIGISLGALTALPRLRAAVASPLLRWEHDYPGSFYPFFFLVAFEFSELFDSVRAAGHVGYVFIRQALNHSLH
jgi:undecaprenyl-diphosphatase